MRWLGWLRKGLLGLSAQEVTCARRGFQGGATTDRQWLEQIGYAFLHGYHAALLDGTPALLARQLSKVEPELCGFAFEGAAMGLCLLDTLTPWSRCRLQNFLAGPGAAHAYIVHVGAGYAPPCRRLTGYACRVFNQGLGRSLWFVAGADVARISAMVAALQPWRQADLWSGIGLACAYAGRAQRGALTALRDAAGPYQAHLAQGVAFAAQARQRAGNPAAHTDLRWTGATAGEAPTVQFDEVTGLLDVSLESSWVLAIGAADLDGDLLPGLWQDLLGQERFQLATMLARETAEDLNAAATRVWTASESLKKAGAMVTAPLVLGCCTTDGWVVLTSGYLRIATVVTSVQSLAERLAFAIVDKRCETTPMGW